MLRARQLLSHTLRHEVPLVQPRSRHLLTAGFSLAATLGAGLQLGSKAPSHLEEVSSTRRVLLSSSDDGCMQKAMADAVERLVGFADAPETFWDEKVTFGGKNEVTVFAKRLEGYAYRVFLGVTTFEDASEAEVVELLTGGPGCRKQHYDPTIERFERAVDFEGCSNPSLCVLRVKLKRILLGIIAAREFEMATQSFSRLPDGRLAELGVSLSEPLLSQALGDLRRALETAPSKEAIRGTNFAGGILEAVGDTGRIWRVKYVAHSELSGGMPLWLMDKVFPYYLREFFRRARWDLVVLQSKK